MKNTDYYEVVVPNKNKLVLDKAFMFVSEYKKRILTNCSSNENNPDNIDCRG